MATWKGYIFKKVRHHHLLLKDDSQDRIAMQEISAIGNDDNYVRMASAWYWAEALSICPESALPYLESREMDPLDKEEGHSEGKGIEEDTKELKKLLNDMK